MRNIGQLSDCKLLRHLVRYTELAVLSKAGSRGLSLCWSNSSSRLHLNEPYAEISRRPQTWPLPPEIAIIFREPYLCSKQEGNIMHNACDIPPKKWVLHALDTTGNKTCNKNFVKKNFRWTFIGKLGPCTGDGNTEMFFLEKRCTMLTGLCSFQDIPGTRSV